MGPIGTSRLYSKSYVLPATGTARALCWRNRPDIVGMRGTMVNTRYVLLYFFSKKTITLVCCVFFAKATCVCTYLVPWYIIYEHDKYEVGIPGTRYQVYSKLQQYDT